MPDFATQLRRTIHESKERESFYRRELESVQRSLEYEQKLLAHLERELADEIQQPAQH